MVGIALNYGWNEPMDPLDPSHVEASERDMQFGVGWFAHPIFKDGTYPPVMREKVMISQTRARGHSYIMSAKEAEELNDIKDEQF